MRADDSPEKITADSGGLYEIAAAATTGLILASADHMTGLVRLWAAETDPVREFRAFAAASVFFAAAALIIQRIVSPVVRPVGPTRAGELRMLCAGGALGLGYVVGSRLPAGFTLLESAARGAFSLLAGSSLLALLLGAGLARLPRSRKPGNLFGRLWTSAAFGLGVFVAAAAWVRVNAPEAGLLWSRLGPALVAGTVWLGCLALLHTRRASGLRAFTVVLFAGIALRAALLGATPRLSADRPPASVPDGISRIVLITIDTLRADALGCYGPEGTSTPNIDALARRGRRYAHAISPAPWTLPSLASLMTGVAVPVHQTTSHTAPVPSALPTLAERLQDAGWVTGAIGRNAFLVGVRGLNRGFQSYVMFPRPPKLEWPTFGGKLLSLILPERDELDVSSERIADLAIEWLETQGDEIAFFWCHFFDPHIPYEPPAEYMPDGPAPERFSRSVTEVRPLRDGDILPTDEEQAWIRQLYLAEVRYVDAQVGRILDTLAELPRADETLVILTSDHGEEFWEHNGFEHGHALYEEVIHVPLILAHPGRIEPGVVEQTVDIRAILPTVMQMLGHDSGSTELYAEPLPEPGPIEPDAAPVFSTSILYGPDQEAVIDQGWKFIRGREEPREELFNLFTDPGERENLAGESPARVQAATGKLEVWRRQATEHRPELSAENDMALDLPEDTLQDLQRLGYIN